jgi:hypothetical protein
MMRSNANVLLASTGMLHCAANCRAMAARIPPIGMTLEYLQSGAIAIQGATRCPDVGLRITPA